MGEPQPLPVLELLGDCAPEALVDAVALGLCVTDAEAEALRAPDGVAAEDREAAPVGLPSEDVEAEAHLLVDGECDGDREERALTDPEPETEAERALERDAEGVRETKGDVDAEEDAAGDCDALRVRTPVWLLESVRKALGETLELGDAVSDNVTLGEAVALVAALPERVAVPLGVPLGDALRLCAALSLSVALGDALLLRSELPLRVPLDDAVPDRETEGDDVSDARALDVALPQPHALELAEALGEPLPLKPALRAGEAEELAVDDGTALVDAVTLGERDDVCVPLDEALALVAADTEGAALRVLGADAVGEAELELEDARVVVALVDGDVLKDATSLGEL